MLAYIRGLISEKYGKVIAEEISILYGGSCNASNAGELFGQPDIDGGLIGGDYNYEKLTFDIRRFYPVRKKQVFAARANFGPMYVLLIDPATGKVEHTLIATLSNGRYTWSKTGYAKTRVQIIAGGDLDNDDLICARGEPCGAFPLLPAGGDYTIVDLSGNRSDLNFQVAPVSGISPASATAGDGAAWPGVRRGTAP